MVPYPEPSGSVSVTDTTERESTIMKKIITSSILALGLAVPTVALSAPAEAYNPGCATRGEFSKIRVGMSVKRTQQIIGSRGRVSLSSSWMSQRQWDVCGSMFGNVTITYVGGQVDNKLMLG